METKVLYIEDNPLNMRLVRKILQKVGHTVIEAVDGNSGLKAVEQFEPDLILLDVNLPDIDGLDIARRLKAMPHLRHIPIIALTANTMYGDRERCLVAGCDDYIAKPVGCRELINAVQYFVSDETAHQELAKA